MDGTDLLNEFSNRVMKRKGTRSISDSALAGELGVTQAALNNYRGRQVTPRQIVNLMEKFAKISIKNLTDEMVVPIVEFLHIDPIETSKGTNWEVFSAEPDGKPHPYLSGLRARLENAHGVYIFHDSRGKAIYAGKSERTSLWQEANKAFNRDRGDVQTIKRVQHPASRVKYRGPDEKRRQISRESVVLHDIASYLSAYQIPDGLIGKVEALIVRSFANDLLNIKMENF